MPWSAPPSIWFRMPSGFEIGPQSCAHDETLHGDHAGVLVDLDLGDDCAVAVVAFVQHAGDAAAAHDAGPPRAARGDGRASHSAVLAAAAHDRAETRIAQVPQPELDRVGLDAARRSRP